jgi:hypothetical protein
MDANTLVITFSEALYISGTAVADNADIASSFGIADNASVAGSIPAISSAIYYATNNTVTLTIANADNYS